MSCTGWSDEESWWKILQDREVSIKESDHDE